MAKTSTEISYDSEEDILNLTRSDRAKASIEIGDFILDVDAQNHIIGLEILHASTALNKTKDELSNITSASLTVTYSRDYVRINAVLTIRDQEKEVTIPLPLELHTKSHRQELHFAA